MANQIEVIITDDGRIIFETDRIEGRHHVAAERMMAEMPKILGAQEVRVTKRPAAHHHHPHHHHQH